MNDYAEQAAAIWACRYIILAFLVFLALALIGDHHANQSDYLDAHDRRNNQDAA